MVPATEPEKLVPVLTALPTLGEDEAATLLEGYAAAQFTPSPDHATWAISVVSALLVESPKGGIISLALSNYWQFLGQIPLPIAIELAVTMAIKACDQQICWKGFSFLKRALERKGGASFFSVYLPAMVAALQPLVSRIYFLAPHELNLFEYFLFLFKETAVVLQDDEQSSLALIDCVVPTVLNVLQCFDPSGPLKDLLNRSTSCSYSRIIELCSFVISNICGSTVACQDHVARLNPVKYVFPMVDARNEDIAEVAWHTINWIIISDISKIDFINIGGAERICKELLKEKLSSRNIVYCARKLAMLPETRQKLIKENAIPSLLKMNKDSKKQVKPVFVSSFALAFVSLETTSPSIEEIRKHKLLETLENNVKHLYQVATKVCLKVLYVQLNHARMLMESPVYASQCFGVWWVLHLLYGQKLERYNRDYRAMAVRDQVVPHLCQFIKESNRDTEFLAMMSLEALWILSTDPALKKDLMSQGALSIFPSLLGLAYTGSELGVLIIHELLSSPKDYLFTEIDSLRSIASNYICEHTSRDQFGVMLDMCDLYQFHHMKAFFLGSLYCCVSIDEHDLQPIHEQNLRAILGIVKEAKRLTEAISVCGISQSFELGNLKDRCMAVVTEASRENDTTRLSNVLQFLRMIELDDVPMEPG